MHIFHLMILKSVTRHIIILLARILKNIFLNIKILTFMTNEIDNFKYFNVFDVDNNVAQNFCFGFH